MKQSTKPIKAEQLQPLLSIPKAAKLLGVSRPTVYSLIRYEGLPIIKMGGKLVRISPVSLQRWIEQREEIA